MPDLEYTKSSLPSIFIRSESEIELTPKVHQCARLEALGFKPGEIANKLGVSNSWVSITRKSPLFKQTVLELERQINEGAIRAKKMLMDVAPEAAQVVADILRDKDENKLRLKKEVSLDLLKGIGALRSEESGGTKIQINISDSKLDLIMQTLKEI